MRESTNMQTTCSNSIKVLIRNQTNKWTWKLMTKMTTTKSMKNKHHHNLKIKSNNRKNNRLENRYSNNRMEVKI